MPLTVEQANSKATGRLPDLIGMEFTECEYGLVRAQLTVRPDLLVLVGGASPLLRPLSEHTWETFQRAWEVDATATTPTVAASADQSHIDQPTTATIKKPLINVSQTSIQV